MKEFLKNTIKNRTFSTSGRSAMLCFHRWVFGLSALVECSANVDNNKHNLKCYSKWKFMFYEHFEKIKKTKIVLSRQTNIFEPDFFLCKIWRPRSKITFLERSWNGIILSSCFSLHSYLWRGVPWLKNSGLAKKGLMMIFLTN